MLLPFLPTTAPSYGSGVFGKCRLKCEPNREACSARVLSAKFVREYISRKLSCAV